MRARTKIWRIKRDGLCPGPLPVLEGRNQADLLLRFLKMR
ncbi:hypothetical protein GCWU000342_00589 [Shuttleworthella satelles DSM 14600]|uniref:Uncharacterized protein n=1 Tax=Shuttleworthella satelles DSM 14600 TaxID=626523 RepID=C4G9D6_9FIRM|nr:hypothetical protein GCWU000342_00589 [Shuttleworthia satelles DSM 14600]